MSPPGGSTLMTSAPRSASSIVQYGPASACVRSSTRTSESGPVRALIDCPNAATLDQHRALAFEDDRPVLLGAPMLEAHDAGVGAIGVALLEHFGIGVERVAVKNRRGEPDSGQPQLGERIFAGVLRRQPDAHRAGDQPEDEALAELRRAHAMLVVVAVGGVQHQLGEHLVFDLADSRAACVTHFRADFEVLEVISGAGQLRDRRCSLYLTLGSKRSEMIRIWISEVPSKILVSRASRQ